MRLGREQSRDSLSLPSSGKGGRAIARSGGTRERGEQGGKNPTPALPKDGEGGEDVRAIVNALRHLVSTYQQLTRGTGASNVARLFVRLLHSECRSVTEFDGGC